MLEVGTDLTLVGVRLCAAETTAVRVEALALVRVVDSWEAAATVSENQIFHRDSHKELLVIYSKSLYKPLILVILGYNPDCSCIVLLLLGF